MMDLNIQLLNNLAKTPDYSYPGDAGLNLYSIESKWLAPNERYLFKLGFAIELPQHFEAQIRPRSGLALKYGVTVLNSPGTIDSNYRGEIGVILINSSKNNYQIKAGDKIAQMVISPVITIQSFNVEKLKDSERGVRGFGSSGL